MPSFNAQQLKAIEYPQRPLLILAGAGTGKTTAIVGRMAHLIQHGGVNPNSILALTFTNDSANHLKQKLIDEIGENGKNIQACTFHSFAQLQTQTHYPELGYTESPKIMTKGDIYYLLRQNFDEINQLKSKMFRRNPVQAIQSFQKVFDAFSVYYLYEKNVTDFEKLLRKIKPEDKKQKEILLLKAYKFSDNTEDLQSQAEAMKRIVKKHPNFVRAEYDLGKTLLQLGQFEDAKKIFSKIIAKNGQHARAAARIKEADKAIQDANKPKLNYDELIAKASRLQQIDRAKEAIRLFEQAIGVDRTRPEAYSGAGWCYIDLEDINAAVKSFNIALEWQPNFADAYMGLGETYHADDRNDLALKNYKKYVGLVPNGPETPVAKRMIKLLTP